MATLGGDLKRRERISARLGDILSMLYLTSAVLKRFNDEGRQVQDLPLVQWACEDNLAKAQLALDELFDNFPNRIAGVVLKRIVFPWGRTLRKASDKIEHQVARIMQTPCEARSRLGLHLYLTDEPGLGLELGVISQEEAAKLRLAEEGRLFVINVDDFEPEYLAADNSLTQQPNGADALNEQQTKKTKAA